MQAMKLIKRNPARCSRIWNEEVKDFALRFLNSPPINWQEASLPELPPEEPDLEKLPVFLEDLVAKADDLVGLYWDRQNLGDLPTEDELVAHFVVTG
jgi:hypothetical protein